ncbi:MAG: response regulator transcription factor [Aquimonas sp.]|jgi:two-component system LytT family response regulator|nr:response regulator transcription factor [Xanthomonadales bacterium]MCC6504867.1 response regulator transcription factor [Aquimonas sp.]
MSRLRVVIVDDERLARAELRRLLAAHPQVEIVGEAEDADAALALIRETQPDLAFLDIQMPGMNGLQLAAEIDSACQFVFCTAFDSFAIDAFGLNALDYLVKPVVPERLAQTLARVRPRSDKPDTPTLPMEHPLLLKFGESARIVRLRDIHRFESVGNHAAVYTPHGRAFLLSSLSRIEQRVDPAYFVRVSRADILRLDAISRLEPDISQGMIARLHDGTEIKVSRRQAQLLKTQMGSL